MSTRQVKLTDLEVRGQKYPVTVDTNGHFASSVGEQGVSATTLEDLRTRLMEFTRRKAVRVSVPATYVHWSGYSESVLIENVVLTGIHSKTRAVLMKRANGKAEVLGSYARETLFKPMTTKEQETYRALLLADKKAGKALAEFQKQFEFVASQTVQRAIDATVVAQEKANAPLDEPEPEPDPVEEDDAASV